MQVKSHRLPALLLIWASLLLARPAGAQGSLYEETSIAGTISGSIRKGHIFKTRSGHIYEVVDYVYLYEYEYSPDVVVLSDGSLYKLVIEGFDEPLSCKCLNCGRVSTSSSPPASDSHESTIKAAQAALTALGFDSGAADGTLGPQTRSALTRFRVSMGLTPGDSLDAATLRAIAAALTKKYPDKSEALSVAVHLIQASENWQATRKEPGQKSPGEGTETPTVLETSIVSDFNGLNHGNIYKLANGQIWEQTEYWIWVWVWVNPQVLIVSEGGIYRMKVEGIEHPVSVRRIK